MKTFKKFTICLMTVCLAFLSFTGCSLFELDTNKYYNQIVASYNNGKITVTMKELINGYYNFGNQDYDNSGDATIEGLESTIKTLLNRKIFIEALKEGNASVNLDKITLTQKQINDAWQSVYDYINEEITSEETTLRKADDAEIPESEESSTDSHETYENRYSPYTKTYTYINGVLQKVVTNEEVVNHSIDVFQISESELAQKTESEKAKLALENFRKLYWNQTDSILYGSNTNTKSYSDEAFDNYIENLKNNETDKSLSKNTADVFYRELDRLFEVYIENAYLTAYQEQYSKACETITENEILETYKKMIETQIETYTTSSSAYTTAMTKEAASVYYHPNTSDWFKVSHILIKFSDEQTKQIETLKNQLNNNDISKENYNKQVEQIKNQTTVTERYYENGVLKYGNTYTAKQVLNMLTKAMEGKSYAEKMKIFNDYIYRFNMDDGVNNADTCYYIPTNPENDQMVESFANESRSLRQQGAGSISSSLVESTYGYHIVMYIGEITQLDYQSATLSSLNNIFINPFDEYASNGVTNGKTMLDVVIEQITKSNYANHEQALIEQIIGDRTITYYSNVYKSLLG